MSNKFVSKKDALVHRQMTRDVVTCIKTIFYLTPGPHYIVYTPQEGTPKYKNFMMISHHVVLPFQLRVKNSANIALSRVPGDVSKDAVEIVIGR